MFERRLAWAALNGNDRVPDKSSIPYNVRGGVRALCQDQSVAAFARLNISAISNICLII